MGTGRIKKNTLRAKMLGILMLCAMTSLLAAGIVSYMALRMIQNDSIEDNMKMYLDQITRNTDGAYYDMLSIMNYMGPGGLVGNVTDSYLGATDNFDRFIEQRTLREEMAGLGYVNTKLVGVMYYDREEKKELISGMNVRALDGSHASLPEVVECAGNVIQAAHSSILGRQDGPTLISRRMREESRGTVQILSLYRDRNSSPQHSQREITRLRQERDIRSWHTGARWDTLMQWRCRTTCIRMRSTIGE